MKANLHLHSTCSDGEYSPLAVMAFMKSKGFDCLALTDHDSTDGLSVAREYCDNNGIRFVGGVELTSYPDGGIVDGFNETFAMHILGYGFDEVKMGAYLKEMHRDRQAAYRRLLRALRSDGYITDEASVYTDNGVVRDKTSIAVALVRAGYAHDLSEAFNEIINKQYVGYILDLFPSAKESIRAIKECGGIAIWAHPYWLKKGGNKRLGVAGIDKMLERYVGYGLDGTESCYLHFNDNEIKELVSLNVKYGILNTTGSDYHGWNDTCLHLLDDDKRITDFTLISAPFLKRLNMKG